MQRARRSRLTPLLVAVVLAGLASAPSGEASLASGPTVVEMRGLGYQPMTLTVTAGDTVVWINRDIVPHTVTEIEREWTSVEMRTGAKWAWVATNEKGDTTRYYCAYHPTMRGIIVVKGE